MRNSGNTSTRLVSRFRGSCLVFIGDPSLSTTSWAALGALADARLLLEDLDRLGELRLHAAGVLRAPADGPHAAPAQPPQHGEGPDVPHVPQLLDQDLAL